MIISHKYQYIFVKTTKTAGTSIEIALSRYCSRRDVITPIGAADEATRREYGGRGPQNYGAPLTAYSLLDFKRLIRLGKRKRWFYNHIAASPAAELIGEKKWRDYYKFCFERNPFDRLISLYYFETRGQRSIDMTLAEFVASDAPLRLHQSGFGLYTIDGAVAVDRVCRYEDLADELERVRLLLGMPEPLSLPKSKSGYRTDRRNYRELLSARDRERIETIFHREMELCGYHW